MKMNDNTILRIKVPAHLYESVKAQLTLKEGKNDYGMPGAKTVKEKKTASDKPKATSAPKKAAAPKNVEAPKEEAKVSQDGHKKMGIEELKTLAELLHAEIAKLEEKSHDKEEKAPVEEKKEEGHEEAKQ